MPVGNYTRGCIDESMGLLDQDAVDAEYRRDDGYLTRSYAHSVYKYGGIGQEMLDRGESLFSGNAGTSFGSLVDRAIPAAICGVPISDLFACPPEDVLSNGARRGKPYTEWKASLAGKREISAEDLRKVELIVANTFRNPAAREILSDTLDCQATFRHTDDAGHKRKSLADGVCDGFIWDYKTTSSDWSQLWRSCVEFGYLLQAAWYQDAGVACGIPDEPLRFIFAQTFKPYAVRVYTFPADMVERARDQISLTLDQIQLRRELGVYRSQEDEEEMEMEFPAYMRGAAHDG